jgi:hypothetical protein
MTALPYKTSNRRIQEGEHIDVSIAKMADNNMGTINVLRDLFNSAGRIDPDATPGGGLNHIILLDDWGIYGSAIWILFKDVCGENYVNLIALIRSVQLGIVRRGILLDELSARLSGAKARTSHSIFKFTEVLEDVRGSLPKFTKDDK